MNARSHPGKPDIVNSCRGRFAPSPTGPMHFGSLITAVGCYLDARSQGGHWYVRMEDIDLPRNVPGADTEILRTLDRYGLHWDGEVVRQSNRTELYQSALEELRLGSYVYPCGCSRREISATGKPGIDAPAYPGTCRNGLPAGRSQHSIRLRTDKCPVEIMDRIQGRICQNLERAVGDFVIHRADGIFAYQLAVVVDDADQGITDVMRGSDLLDSTPRQVYLQQTLGLMTPGYAHLPVAVNRKGQKLSKQTGAEPLDTKHPLPALFRALRFLGQQPPDELLSGDLASFWEWAVNHWSSDKVPRQRKLPVEGITA